MAKKNKKIIPDRVIKVKSKTYGRHERAARGTYKTATLNSVLQRSADETAQINSIAKSIKDNIDPFREGVKDGSMWRRLLSIVRTHLTNGSKFNFASLVSFEFDTRCKLDSLFATGYELIARKDEPKTLELRIASACKLNLKRDTADTYRLTLIVLSFGPDSVHTSSEIFNIPLKSRVVTESVMILPIPEVLSQAVIVVKCEFLEGGFNVSIKNRHAMKAIGVSNFRPTSGIRIVL